MQRFHFGVVTYKNSSDQIERLYKSIATSCHLAQLPFDVTLLHNSKSELAPNFSETFPVREIAYAENLGFGRAHNMIVEEIDDPDSFYVGLNPDGFLFPTAMQAVLSWGPRGDTLYEFLQFPQEHPKAFDAKTGEVPWCSGAAFMVNAGLFRELGGFDERFFMYCEDVDLSWRVLRKKGRCVCMGNAKFFHDISDGRTSENTIRQMLISQVILADKWGSRFARWRAIMQLRRICRRSSLPFPKLPRTSLFKFTRPPAFCDFSRGGSYGSVRW